MQAQQIQYFVQLSLIFAKVFEQQYGNMDQGQDFCELKNEWRTTGAGVFTIILQQRW